MDTKFNPLQSLLKPVNSFNAFHKSDAQNLDPDRLLENILAKSMNGYPDVNKSQTIDFSPQAVADRILDFVGSSIALRASNDEEAMHMLQQAREGIEKGISDARDILTSLSSLTDEVDSTINETEDLIFKGLDELAQSYTDEALISPESQLISATGAIDTKFEQTKSAMIEIVTQDGDRVEVNYSAFIQSASSEQASSNQQGASYSYESSQFSSVKFQFSVQGELDAGEQQAINDLLEDMGNLASQFFSGDVQAAFNSAMELGLDGENLKSFALDFQQSTYVEVKQTYQQVEQQVSPAPAINVIAQLQDLIEQVKENALIEQPENTLKSLLTGMLNNVNQGVDSPLEKYIKDIIDVV